LTILTEELSIEAFGGDATRFMAVRCTDWQPSWEKQTIKESIINNKTDVRLHSRIFPSLCHLCPQIDKRWLEAVSKFLDEFILTIFAKSS